MANNIISSIKLKIRVKLTQIHYDEATIFDSQGDYLAWSHWYIGYEQNALDPGNWYKGCQ